MRGTCRLIFSTLICGALVAAPRCAVAQPSTQPSIQSSDGRSVRFASPTAETRERPPNQQATPGREAALDPAAARRQADAEAARYVAAQQARRGTANPVRPASYVVEQERERAGSEAQVDESAVPGEETPASRASQPYPSLGAKPFPARNAGKRLGAPGRAAAAASVWPTVITIVSSLSIVLGLFFVVVVVLRRGTPKGLQALPRDALEVLGRAMLPARQQVCLVRCGRKLLLINVTAGGAETLSEITDPQEVEYLTGLCRQGSPESATATFRAVLQEMGQERHAPGFVDAPAAARRGMFSLGRREEEVAHA